MSTEKVKIGVRLLYDSAKFISWQLFYASEELDVKNKRAEAEVPLDEYRQLRWYAASNSSGQEFTVRIDVPTGYRLRYPGVPVAKVDPDINGKTPKTPAFLDFSGWRRIKLERVPPE